MLPRTLVPVDPLLAGNVLATRLRHLVGVAPYCLGLPLYSRPGTDVTWPFAAFFVPFSRGLLPLVCPGTWNPALFTASFGLHPHLVLDGVLASVVVAAFIDDGSPQHIFDG